mmetsp:Transcript_20625/g.45169  ORF Transcript_20625/g.45169 Transcript_20625/m.45169 type:complete len:502 (-) Transcript_20625:80-1585(-)
MATAFPQPRSRSLWGRLLGGGDPEQTPRRSVSATPAKADIPAETSSEDPKRCVVWEPGPGAAPPAESPLTLQTEEKPARTESPAAAEPQREAEEPVACDEQPAPPDTRESLEEALVCALDDLKGHRLALETLRNERRNSVPLADVERWCESMAKQLCLLGDRLSSRLEVFQERVRRRDRAIRHLHGQLHEKLTSRDFTVRSDSQMPVAAELPTALNLSSLLREEKQSPMPSRLRRPIDRNALKGLTRRNGSDGGHSQERAQPMQVQREAAQQLRRGSTDLVGQLRTRDAQVEQLNAVIRELIQQRQQGVQKRQLNVNLQDGLAQFDHMREVAAAVTPQHHSTGRDSSTREARIVRTTGVPSAAAAPSSGPPVQALATPMQPIDRRCSRPVAVASPRGAPDADLIRGAGTGSAGGSTGSCTFRRDRDRSNSVAPPYTPRGKQLQRNSADPHIPRSNRGPSQSTPTPRSARSPSTGPACTPQERVARRLAREGLAATARAMRR